MGKWNRRYKIKKRNNFDLEFERKLVDLISILVDDTSSVEESIVKLDLSEIVTLDLENKDEYVLKFSATLSSFQRKSVHSVAEKCMYIIIKHNAGEFFILD